MLDKYLRGTAMNEDSYYQVVLEDMRCEKEYAEDMLKEYKADRISDGKTLDIVVKELASMRAFIEDKTIRTMVHNIDCLIRDTFAHQAYEATQDDA